LRRLDQEALFLSDARNRNRRIVMQAIETRSADVNHLRARARGLSPAATLDRGYAVVQGADGAVIRDPGDVSEGDLVTVTVQHGAFHAGVVKEHATKEATP